MVIVMPLYVYNHVINNAVEVGAQAAGEDPVSALLRRPAPLIIIIIIIMIMIKLMISIIVIIIIITIT